MVEQWTEITNAIRSSDPDRVNEAVDRVGELERDTRLQYFDTGFDELASIYEQSSDGYVRQSVVRVLDELSPGMAVAVWLADSGDATDVDAATVENRLDSAAGFFLEAIQDDDGRVRQSAIRALKDAYRGYEALEDGETSAALATELGELADQYEGSRRDHLLESKEDAQFFREPVGTRMIETVRQFAEQSDER